MPPKKKAGRKSTFASITPTPRDSDLENDGSSDGREGDEVKEKTRGSTAQKGGKANTTSGKSQVCRFTDSVPTDD
jgi:hypothetical protein